MSINYNTAEYDKKYIDWLKEENRRLAERLAEDRAEETLKEFMDRRAK